MTAKAVLFNDHRAAKTIIAAADPATIKHFGRGGTPFDASTWETRAYGVVKRVN